jgi:hypothetical protein
MQKTFFNPKVLPQLTLSTKIGRLFVLKSCFHPRWTNMENEI